MSQWRKAVDSMSTKGFTTASQYSKSKSKYDKVGPKTNSGYHMGKMMEDFDFIQQNFRFKADEIFTRIKISLLVALICESAHLEDLRREDASPQDVEEVLEDMAIAKLSISHDAPSKKVTYAAGPLDYDIPYLLLDVRDADEYQKSHIITALNYPKHLLARGNYETQALLKYKNHPRHVIVVYDEDEIIAPHVATTLMERGYTNVYVLSGGLKVAKHCFPHSLVVSEGTQMTVDISQILAAQLQQMSLRYKK